MPRRRNLRQQRSPSPEPTNLPDEDKAATVDDAAPLDPGPSNLNKPELESNAVTLEAQGQAESAGVEETRARPALEVLYCEGARQGYANKNKPLTVTRYPTDNKLDALSHDISVPPSLLPPFVSHIQKFAPFLQSIASSARI
jgi:hypothetical protein